MLYLQRWRRGIINHVVCAAVEWRPWAILIGSHHRSGLGLVNAIDFVSNWVLAVSLDSVKAGQVPLQIKALKENQILYFQILG